MIDDRWHPDGGCVMRRSADVRAQHAAPVSAVGRSMRARRSGRSMLRPYILSLLLAACAGASDDAAGGLATGNTAPLAPAVRDSAGVAIFEHAADAFERAPRFVMSEKPVTEVKGSGFEVELTRVWQPMLLADGRIVFYAEGSVVVVGADGGIVERIGRDGEGPGEFRDGEITRGLGDTVIVYDRAIGRVSVVVPGGGVVRSRAFRSDIELGVMTVVGQLSGDRLLLGTEGITMTPSLAADPNPKVQWRSARLEPMDDSVVFVLVDSVPGPELRARGNRGVDVVLNTAYPVTTGWGEEFLISPSSRWELRRMRADGALMARIVAAVPRRATDEAGIKADVDAQFARSLERRSSARMEGPPLDTTTLRRRANEWPRADSLPSIGKALIGPDGVAWIKDGGYSFAQTTWAWTAVNKDGTILGRLVGKGKDPVVAFGANRVMLKSEDADGFVTFRVHTLTVGR